MAEHPRTSREFTSPPPHADAGTKQWVSSLLPVLQRSYMNVRVLTASANIDVDDSVLLCNTGTGNITVTLPPVEQVTGKIYSFKKTASSNTLTIDPHSTELIDGSSTSKTLTDLRSGFTVISTGTAWEAVPPDYLNQDVTFTEDITIGDPPKIYTSGTTVPIFTIRAGSGGSQMRFNSEDDSLRWIWVLADDDDDGDNDGGELSFLPRLDSGSATGSFVQFDRSPIKMILSGHNTSPDLRIQRTGTAAGDARIQVASTGMFIGHNSTESPNTDARLILDTTATLNTDETAVSIRHKAGGTTTIERISVGAVDSGGAGFRVLRIPN